MNESDYIIAAMHGDAEAFEQLVLLYEKKIFSVCLRLCRNREDAADAAQDTFLSAWRAIAKFRQDSAFSTWLHRLAVNACIDRMRKEKHHAGEASLDDETCSVTLQDTAPAPETLCEQKELREDIAKALRTLPEEYARILLLREMQQLSYAEIAQREGMELGTVKSRLSRARRQLRTILERGGNFFVAESSKRLHENEEGEGMT